MFTLIPHHIPPQARIKRIQEGGVGFSPVNAQNAKSSDGQTGGNQVSKCKGIRPKTAREVQLNIWGYTHAANVPLGMLSGRVSGVAG